MELLKWHFAHGQTVKLLEKIQPGLSFLFEQSENSERFHVNKVSGVEVESLSSNVFERRTSTGSGLFSFFDGGFAQIFSQIASITVKKLRNTNFISSRHVKRENTSLPVDVRHSKTSLLKLPNDDKDRTCLLQDKNMKRNGRWEK